MSNPEAGPVQQHVQAANHLPPEWFTVLAVLVALWLLWRIMKCLRAVAWNIRIFAEDARRREQRQTTERDLLKRLQ